MALASLEPLRPPRSGRVRSARIELADGARTMVHVARYDVETTELRVAVLRGQARLEDWCAARGHEEALVGGFFVRPDGLPLGEVRTRGVARRHVPFDAPWDAVRVGADPEQAHLRESVHKLHHAIGQVFHAAEEGQQRRVRELLDETRRKIYAILSEEG